MASPQRDEALDDGSIDPFAQFRSLLFLYMVYQLPPLNMQMTATRHGRIVGFGDLSSIIELGPRASWSFAGAFAWYDLLAGFANLGYVFSNDVVRQINHVINTAGWTPDDLDPILIWPLSYDPSHVFLPQMIESTLCSAEREAEDISNFHSSI